MLCMDLLTPGLPARAGPRYPPTSSKWWCSKLSFRRYLLSWTLTGASPTKPPVNSRNSLRTSRATNHQSTTFSSLLEQTQGPPTQAPSAKRAKPPLAASSASKKSWTQDSRTKAPKRPLDRVVLTASSSRTNTGCWLALKIKKRLGTLIKSRLLITWIIYLLGHNRTKAITLCKTLNRHKTHKIQL